MEPTGFLSSSVSVTFSSISLEFGLSIRIAEQAVGFDRQGDYAKAVSLYSVCSTLLSAELNVQRVGTVHMNRRGIVAVVRR